MTPFDYRSRTRVLFGAGEFARLGEMARELGGTRCLLVADQGMIDAGYVQEATRTLKARRMEVFGFHDFEVNPTAAMVEAGRVFAAPLEINLIVGLGGGSSMDCAKGINFVLTNGGAMQDYWGYGKALRSMLPMIAVPTTAGTGSEAQSYALISDSATHVKMACGDPKAAFRAAILDPKLTISQPAAVTAATGYDAISHAVETLVSTRGNAISECFSREAWRLLNASFEKVLANPNDVDARGAMLAGAHFAGLAIENSMLGATHACANPLTAHYDIPHGVAIALLLSHVVEFNSAVAGEMYLDLHSGDLSTRLRELAEAAGLPLSLSDAQVPEEALPRLAEEASAQWTGKFNPRVFDSAAAHRDLPMRLLALLFTACALHAAGDWPQFRGNPSLTGVSTSPVPKTLKLLWTFDAGDSIESSAAIVDGTVYVGSETAELIAVNLADGKLKWKYKVKDGIGESSPAVSDGIVVVGDLSGVVHGVSAKDGKGIWTFAAASEVKASPVIVNGRVIIGSYDGNLYALGLNDGKVAWQFRTNGPVHATASVAAGLAYISGCDGVLRGIRIADGKEMVQITTGSYTGASPALASDAAYFGTFDNVVLAFNLKTKKPLWQYQDPSRQFPFYSSAAIVNGRVIVGGRDKFVHCLDAKTGKALWSVQTKSRVESSPAVVDGRVYVGSNDGRFYVLDVATGAKLWEFNAGAPLSASPAVAQGRIVIGSQDGKLYCFGG